MNITGRMQRMEICKYRAARGDEKIDEEGIGRCSSTVQKKTHYKRFTNHGTVESKIE